LRVSQLGIINKKAVAETMKIWSDAGFVIPQMADEVYVRGMMELPDRTEQAAPETPEKPKEPGPTPAADRADEDRTSAIVKARAMKRARGQ
jgi:hypothetical protein